MMRNIYVLVIFITLLCIGGLFAQEDQLKKIDESSGAQEDQLKKIEESGTQEDQLKTSDIPYLSDEDQDALKTILPEDEPDRLRGDSAAEARTLYHLLILDRAQSPSSDLDSSSPLSVLYKFLHKENGYLVALFTVSDNDEPVLPVRAGQRVVIQYTTAYPASMREFIHSAVFRRYVTIPAVISGLANAAR